MEAVNPGITTSELLGVVFVVLKLTHVIAWSWWWVLMPFYLPLVFVALVGLGVVIYTILERR